MVSWLVSLVQSCCGEGEALQTNVTGMCGEHWQCSGHTGFAPACKVCFPHLHCSGSRLLYMEQALCCVRFQFSGTGSKHGLGCTCVLRLPRPSGSDSQELAGRPLPSTAPAPVPAHAGQMRAPCVSPRPSRQMLTIQNLRRSLRRKKLEARLQCSRARACPFPLPLPPASGGAGPVCSLRALLWTCSEPLFCEWPAVCLP